MFPWIATCLFALSLCLVTSSGCESAKKNPRTTGTIAGGAAGAAAGAAIDKDHPAEGAVIGGAIGAGAGNYGGKVYKDKHND
jgi:phage tail tape-measure protein